MNHRTTYVDAIIVLDQGKPGNFIVREDANGTLSLLGIKNQDKLEAPKNLIAQKFNFNGIPPKFDTKYTHTFTEKNVDGLVFLLETEINYHQFCGNNEIPGETYISLSLKEIQTNPKARPSLKEALTLYSNQKKQSKKIKKTTKKRTRA